MKSILIAIFVWSTAFSSQARNVTTQEGRKKNLLEYIESRDDLDKAGKATWNKAIRLRFGGKSLKDGTDEGVTVAKSVISAAIFFDIPAEKAAETAPGQ